MDLNVLADMVMAHTKAEDDAFDREMILLSWQTALLMNSTGNYKKKIKPEDLYVPADMQKEQEKKQAEGFNPEKRQELQNDLLSAFAGSDVVIQ